MQHNMDRDRSYGSSWGLAMCYPTLSATAGAIPTLAQHSTIVTMNKPEAKLDDSQPVMILTAKPSCAS